MSDTIYAVSSGQPPAAIAVLRISGPAAEMVAVAVAGGLPQPRRATVRRLRGARGETLDHALALWFPGPATVTGEDLLELHVHGGQAVIAAVERAIEAVPDTRRAQAGEFTRRGLHAGRIDLAQAAGLADLLQAETETQRRVAITASEGAVSRRTRGWLNQLSAVRAELEASIDYDEDGDIAPTGASFAATLADLASDLAAAAAAPTVEQLRRGWQVVIAGPPNAGKSSLFNAMIGEEIAIVTPIAGTTRDRITARLQRRGQIVTLVDTAGLADHTADPVEAIGIELSRKAMSTADLVLWLGIGTPAFLGRPRIMVCAPDAMSVERLATRISRSPP